MGRSLLAKEKSKQKKPTDFRLHLTLGKIKLKQNWTAYRRLIREKKKKRSKDQTNIFLLQ